MTNSTANANCFIIDLVFGEKTLYNIWRDRRMRDVSPMIDDHLDCGNCSTSSQINIDGAKMLILRADVSRHDVLSLRWMASRK